LVVGAIVAAVVKRSPAPSSRAPSVERPDDDQSTGIRAHGAEDPTIQMVTELVRAHRDAYLNYEIGLEVARHDASLSVRDALLDGAEPVLAAPVLELSEISRNLSSKELLNAVRTAIRELGLETMAESGGPRAQATSTCQRWARNEAASRFRQRHEEQNG